MVIHSSNRVSPSSGLLPTPPRQSNGSISDSFVGRSYYPLPYPLVTILEGSNISELISWDISVTSKVLKLKMEWSASTKDSDVCLISDLLPNNVLYAINCYNIIQPSWSTSAAKNKLSTKIEWQISSSNSNQSTPNSAASNITSSSFKSPNVYSSSSQNRQNLTDSGFGSLNSNSSIHGDSHNWRRSINLPSKPIFDSPRLPNRHHDIYVAPKCKDHKASTNKSNNSLILPPNNKKSSSPGFAQKVKSINTKPDSSNPEGKTPNRRIENPSDSNPSANVSKDSNPNIKSKTTPLKKDQSKNTDAKPTTSQNSVSSTPLIASDESTTIQDQKTTNVAASSPSKPTVVFPVTPKGFPKNFFDTPNPLPIVGDGFLDPKTDAHFMNIQGTCRLCDSSVPSYLVDLHLLNCSGLERRPLDSFVKSIMKDTSLKKKQVIEASKLYSKFELNEASLPNKYFKKTDKYRLFARKVEDLTKDLQNEAFKKLNISPKLETFNILKYKT